MSTTTEEKTSLTVTRTFAAPQERVFAAWTKPEHIKHWFGGEICTPQEIDVDLRVGGAYRFRVASEKFGTMTACGVYREVTPFSKLSYTWLWEEDPAYVNHETFVTVEFIDKGATTEVRLTHENFPAEENRDNHAHGWQNGLDNLEHYLAS